VRTQTVTPAVAGGVTVGRIGHLDVVEDGGVF